MNSPFSILSNSYNQGDVIGGNSYSGGLVGFVSNSNGIQILTNSGVFLSKIKGNSSITNILVGNIGTEPAGWTNNYYWSETRINDGSVTNLQNARDVLTAELRQQSWWISSLKFDSNIWNIAQDVGTYYLYPRLIKNKASSSVDLPIP